MSIVLEPLLYLILMSPLLLLGKRQVEARSILLVGFIGYFLLDNVLVRLPLTVPELRFLGLTMNWEGKILSYLGAGLFLLLFRHLPREVYGLIWQQAPDSKRFAHLTLLIVTLLITVYGFLIGGYSGGGENILFQLTMPSIVEEITYRGILLGLLNAYYQRSFRWGKTSFGVGLIITSLLFGLLHGLSWEWGQGIGMNWAAFIFTGIIGLILGLVRERTGSLLYPIVLHILINLIPNLVGYFV